MTAELSLIWCQDAHGGIGHQGDLPWHLPEDLAHFRATTRGHGVIMGSRTWLSLPQKVRPLPGRTNVVLSSDPNFAAPGATVCTSLTAALDVADGQKVYVIGGAQVYAQAIAHASELVVTTLDRAFPADAHAPVVDQEWVVGDRSPAQGWTMSASGVGFAVTRYVRAGG